MLNTEQTDHPMSVVMLWIAVDVPTSRVDDILLINTELKQAAELGCVQLLLALQRVWNRCHRCNIRPENPELTYMYPPYSCRFCVCYAIDQSVVI